MGWREITNYSFLWNGATNRFEICLWLVAGTRNQQVPDHRLPNLDAVQFSALMEMLRGDVDHKLFYDSVTNLLSSGVDQV